MSTSDKGGAGPFAGEDCICDGCQCPRSVRK